MQDRNTSLLWLVAAVPLAVAVLLALFWPGPSTLAFDDRIPLALLFGIPVVLIAERVRREYA